MTGLLVMTSGLLIAGLARAQEPVLDVQPPAAAPILEPVATNEAPAAPEATPAPVEVPAVTNAPPAPAVTNAPPVVEVVPVPVVPVLPLVTNVPPEVVVDEDSPARAWKDTSWQLGTRYLDVQLEEKTRGTPFNNSYFGSIATLAEDQDSAPDKLYLQYRIMKSPIWIGVSRDHVRAETLDDMTGDGVADPGSGDGTADLSGFIPYIQVVWDNKTRLTPYVQVGYGFYKADFEENAWGGGGYHRVDLEGSVNGLELAGGLHVRLYKNLAADLFAKSMQIDDVKGAWYTAYGRVRGGDVVLTMSYVAYGAGISYRF
jgi:hypothetical protein